MGFGVDYYPEHWPEDRWEHDARLMKDMGLDVVRIAEFSWHKMQPAPDRFEFDWIEKVLEILGRYAIKAVLGTPTAAPPAWLIEAHPEILPVDSHGLVRSFGGRHHDCQSNRQYRNAIATIVGALADRFGTDSRIIGWQVDNELGNSHEDFCHCESCRRAFHAWLERRYETVDHLNIEWGTGFWSQTYDHFGQIPTPRVSPNAHNPALLLDWKRFHSDLVVEFQSFQIRILRDRIRDQFITHNFMAFFDVPDYFDLATELDFVSHDQYPTGYWESPPGPPPGQLAAALDMAAGFKGRPFWVMEQQAGPTGWQIMGRTPERGQLALWALQSIAHGADTIVFFRWRTCTVGTEQYWHGVLPHNGVPGRRFDELSAFISTISPLMERFEGTLNGAEVGILQSYEQNWAMEIQPHHPDLDYNRVSLDFYEAFFRRNIPVTYLSADMDFESCKLVVAPLLYLDIPGLAERLKTYVRSGGHVVLTARTGVKTYNNGCQTDNPLPGPYVDMLGLEILDYDCLRGVEIPIAPEDLSGHGRYWWDTVTCTQAEGLFPCAGREHAGEPALTRNRYGDGQAWYVGTFPDAELMDRMADWWIREAGVESLGEAGPGIELVRRTDGRTEFLFVLNHLPTHAVYDPGSDWAPLAGNTKLESYGYALYRRTPKAG